MILGSAFTLADGGLVVAVIALLFLAAILALAETSLVRTSRVRAKALEDQGRHGARSLRRLADKPERFLAPVLLLVLICQLTTATLVTVLAERLFGGLGVLFGTLFEIVVIFVAAEAIPKDWAVRHPDRAALFSAPLVSAVIAFPPVHFIASLLIGLAQLFTGGEAPRRPEPDLTEFELHAIADAAVTEEVIAHEEREIITSIIEFGDTIVREVMAPRPDIVGVDSAQSVDDALDRAIAAGLSRIPVHSGSLDDIVGVAYSRDLMQAVRDGKGAVPVSELSRPARYVPETKRVAPLLREMQQEKYHMAIVVDEYGGTAGIVTLEDLIEELVGEITDEYDSGEPSVESLGARGYRVPGKMPVDEVNDLLHADLPVGDWDTIGGLFLHLVGQVPAEGESIEVAGHELVAERVVRRRIQKVRIVPLEVAAAPSEETSAESNNR